MSQNGAIILHFCSNITWAVINIHDKTNRDGEGKREGYFGRCVWEGSKMREDKDYKQRKIEIVRYKNILFYLG